MACLLLAGLIALILVTGVTYKQEAAKNAENAGEIKVLTVETIPAESDDSFEISRTYSGITRSANTVDLSFPRAGRLEKFYVDKGDVVRKGDTLAELDKKKLELQESKIDDALASTAPGPKSVTQVDADLVQLDLEDSVLTAPFDGVIALRQISAGSVVSPGAPVLRIVQRNDLEAWISVPVDVVEGMKVGETHPLLLGEKETKAPITAILPEVDLSTRTRTVVFTFDEKASSEILPGTVVRLQLNRKTNSEGIWLPLAALTRESRGLWSVFVAEPDEGDGRTVSRAYVEIVHTEADRVRVRGTFAEDAQIVSAGTHRIVPGQKVRLQSDPPADDAQGEEEKSETEEEETQ